MSKGCASCVLLAVYFVWCLMGQGFSTFRTKKDAGRSWHRRCDFFSTMAHGANFFAHFFWIRARWCFPQLLTGWRPRLVVGLDGLGIIAAYSRSITRLHGLEKGAVLGLRCIIAQFEQLVAIGPVKGADAANFNCHGNFPSLGYQGMNTFDFKMQYILYL